MPTAPDLVDILAARPRPPAGADEAAVKAYRRAVGEWAPRVLFRKFEELTHLEWAERKARALSRSMRLNESEEEELVAASRLILWRRVVGEEGYPAFDVSQVPGGGSADGQLRGLVHQSLKFDLYKLAIRLRSGGVKGGKMVRVDPLPVYQNELGEEEEDVTDGRCSADPDAADALAVLIDRAELDVTEEQVVRALYGAGADRATADELALRYGVAVEQVRAYAADAMAKLRRFAVLAGLVAADELPAESEPTALRAAA